MPAVRGQGKASVVQVGRGMSGQNPTWKGYQSAVLGSEFTETLPYPSLSFSPLISTVGEWGVDSVILRLASLTSWGAMISHKLPTMPKHCGQGFEAGRPGFDSSSVTY